MENEQIELEHDGVSRDLFISDIHYYNEVEFYHAFDELIHQYDFLLDIDNYWDDIPADTAERFEMFKKSSAQYYNLLYQQEYKDLTLRNNINEVVTGLYKECMQMIDDPNLKTDKSEYSTIFLEATRFINSFGTKQPYKAINHYSQRDVETYVYLLLREGYFKTFPLPDEAFDINRPNSSYHIIAKVYARYFLFKEFIDPIYAGLNKEEPNTANITKYNNTYHPKSVNTLHETRMIIEIIREQFRDKYDKIFEILSETNPLASVADRLKMNKNVKSQLLRYDNDLRFFQKQFVSEKNDGVVIVNSLYRMQRFMTYLFAYMYCKEWFDLDENGNRITDQSFCNMVGNSVNYPYSEKEQLRIDRGQFVGIRKKIKNKDQKLDNNYYVHFINLLLDCI